MRDELNLGIVDKVYIYMSAINTGHYAGMCVRVGGGGGGGGGGAS